MPNDFPHVRLLVGQTVLYTQVPAAVCEIAAVHDEMCPVLYDVLVPLDAFPGHKLTVRNVFPSELRAVDQISL